MVYFIGAGPGDPGLITVRGLELLKKCDAVIYDRLGTNELLEVVPDSCKRVYVGKQPGVHIKRQEEINEILVEIASKYQSVVRLKGGDPFVFGRGGEEILELQKHKIPFQVIPGVTSAIAIPELLGIPVTHRGVSRSFHVFTGHTEMGEEAPFSHIHKEDGSSIFLMGVSQIEGIVQTLVNEGEDLKKPVTVISNGTLPGEKKVVGTLEDIVEKVHHSGISSPAIIFVGDTASYSLVSEGIGPLSGKKIGVVGTKSFRERMRVKLEERGASLYTLGSMEVIATKELEKIKQELNQITKYDWILFTSRNGVKLFFEKVRAIHFDVRNFAAIKFAVIGSGTKEMLWDYGLEAEYSPEFYTTKALANGLKEVVRKEERILIPRAVRGSAEMLAVFDEHHLQYHVVPIYDVCGKRTPNWEDQMNFDVIVFASSSGVDFFVEELRKESEVGDFEQQRKKQGVLIAAIGEITAKTLHTYGIEVDIVPKQCDLDGLIASMEEYDQRW